jgi:hypothetical protein
MRDFPGILVFRMAPRIITSVSCKLGRSEQQTSPGASTFLKNDQQMDKENKMAFIASNN